MQRPPSSIPPRRATTSPARPPPSLATTSQLAPAQPRHHLSSATPRPSLATPLSSPPPSLATTSVGACSSCDDRRNEPYSERASSSRAERRAVRPHSSALTRRQSPKRMLGLPKRSPARAWGNNTASQVEPIPSSQQPLSATPAQPRNYFSARPAQPRHHLSARPTSSLATTSQLAPAQPRHNLGRRMFLMRRPAGEHIGERASSSRAERRADVRASEHLELLGRAPNRDRRSEPYRRVLPPLVGANAPPVSPKRMLGLPKRSPARAWGRQARPPKSSPFQARSNLSARPPPSPATTSQLAPAQPPSSPLSATPSSLATPLSSPPPSLATTSVGACSSCDDRRSEPYRRASIFLSGRAPSG